MWTAKPVNRTHASDCIASMHIILHGGEMEGRWSGRYGVKSKDITYLIPKNKETRT